MFGGGPDADLDTWFTDGRNTDDDLGDFDDTSNGGDDSLGQDGIEDGDSGSDADHWERNLQDNPTASTITTGILWAERRPPTEVAAKTALDDLEKLLRPPRGPRSKGYKEPEMDGWSRRHLEAIATFLKLYTAAGSSVQGQWMKASEQAALAHHGNWRKKKGKEGSHTWQSRSLRQRAKDYIAWRLVPVNPYGEWTKCLLDRNEDLRNDLLLHLQSCGKYVKAEDIINYVNKPENLEKYGLKTRISLATAKRWMHRLGYRWVRNHKGQYVDGHERRDVVEYRDKTYVPKIIELDARVSIWKTTNVMEEEEYTGPRPRPKRVVIWYHDESTFYAHDRRTTQWVHVDASPEPYAKGEGVSMMVADFVSAEHGWLRSKDGTESARVIFKAGKNRDGYFSATDVLAQATRAMDIVARDFPLEDHVFVYDNAPTHLKRSDDCLSASKMPKFTPKIGTNWGIEVNARDEQGNIRHGEDGKPLRTKIPMGNAKFRDGRPQELYFPAGHERAGVFKGMAVILEERGYGNMSKVRAECKDFKCPPCPEDEQPTCCCRRILYHEPDFLNVPSLLDKAFADRGFDLIFLPKFHCELNPIEQCWGRAKYLYRMNPRSSSEADLEKNMLAALDAVTVQDIRKYDRRARRFLDAYHKGLDGQWAAWANKTFKGHGSHH